VTAASSQLPASSKSTRLLLEAASWRLEAPSDSSIRTLRCVWSEKTTVCRIFSCQRIVEATSCRPCDLQPWSVSPSDASFSPELLIVTSPRGECKLKLTLSHEVHLRRFAATGNRQAASNYAPNRGSWLANRGSLTRQVPASEGWRIPGSNR
jgi:hypothetical protein